MNRHEAYGLLTSHLSNRNLIKHCIACEGAMARLARHFGEDEGPWLLAGLLHDIDLDLVSGDMAVHGERGAAILEQAGLDPAIAHAVRAHNSHVPRTTRIDYALYAADPATGLIVAAALMHPARTLAALDSAFLMKRFGERRFAAGASREQIRECAKLGLELEPFLGLVLEGMQSRAGEIGL